MFGKSKLKLRVEELEVENSFLTSQIQKYEKERNPYPDSKIIEIYMYNLMRFICSQEFIDLKSEKQLALKGEFETIKYTFGILSSFTDRSDNIVAYRDESKIGKLENRLFHLNKLSRELEDHEKFEKSRLDVNLIDIRNDQHFVYSFSCVEVAAKVLSCDESDIALCLGGKIDSVNDYIFEHESSWQRNQPTVDHKYNKRVNKWLIETEDDKNM